MDKKAYQPLTYRIVTAIDVYHYCDVHGGTTSYFIE